MPICPECNLGLPYTYTACPDCGGSLHTPDSVDRDDAPDILALLEVEPEPEPDPEPEPEPEPKPVREPKRRPTERRRTRNERNTGAPRARPSPRVRAPRRERKETVRTVQSEATELEVVEEPEPQPEPLLHVVAEPEPEPNPVEIAKVRTKRKPKTKPEPAPILEAARTEVAISIVVEVDTSDVTYGQELGTLREVAGFGSRARTVTVCETALVATRDEVIVVESIETATLKKTRLDLYRELVVTRKDGAKTTMRWLPEHNDDHIAVPLLRSALGERLSSFAPERSR